MSLSDEFVEHQGIYLLNHSVGLPLRGAEAAATKAFWQPWQAANGQVWDHWLQAIECFRQQLADLFNNESANFCPQTSLSSAVAKIIDSVHLDKNKNCILLSEEDFPSIAFALQKAAGEGYRLKFIPANQDSSDLSVWQQQITQDVGLVLVTHVQSNNGRQLPVAAITEFCRHRGIVSIVDIAQSAGIVPIDFCVWHADFVVGSCVKWIGGGPGAAYLWVNPRIIDRCEPRTVGWFSHRDPFEFDIHHFDYAGDALRFWGGTPSVYPFVVATRSLAFINQIGVETIRKQNLNFADTLIAGIREQYLISPREHQQRGGTLILDFGSDQSRVIEQLQRSQVHFDSRAKGIRLSPHICNNEAEIALLADCLANCLADY